MRGSVAWRTSGRIIALSTFIILVSGLLSWSVNALFTIRNVEVTGGYVSMIIDPAKLPRNILFFPIDTVRNQILKDYPLVRSVTIRRRYPSTIIITITQRTPFAVVGRDNEIYAIDEEAVVLGKYPTTKDLPTVSIPLPPMQPGDRISDQAITTAVGFLRETASILPVSDIVLHDDASLRAQAVTMSIVFAQRADTHSLARSLQTMITGFRIRGTLPTTIDFRFDKPVVIF